MIVIFVITHISGQYRSTGRTQGAGFGEVFSFIGT